MTAMEFWGWDEESGLPEGEYPEVNPTLETGAYLDDCGEIDRDLQRVFMDFAETMPEASWFETLEAFVGEFFPGWECGVAGNTYNDETDLSQTFEYRVFVNPEEVSDWVWADDGEWFAVLMMHCGCDVRGGYGRPIFVTERFSRGGEGYPVPLDLSCDLYVQPLDTYKEDDHPILPGMTDPADEMMRIAEDFCERLNGSGEWSCAYSRYPWGEAQKFIRKLFPKTYAGGETGVEVEVSFDWDGQYGVTPGDEETIRVNLFAEAPYC
jgi:hypothetical protein